MSKDVHITTRRGFIVAMGFGGVSLYGLWAAYGAAPGPLALLGLGHGHGEADGHGAHGGGHGAHGATSGADVERFRDDTLAFIERHRQPDGSVAPRLPATLADHGHAHGDHGGHGEAVAPAGDEVIEVPLAAGMWTFLPGHLRLEAGRPYRFRMMAMDVSHGASIQFGRGGRMVRLRPGRETEMEITFHEPGRYLVYCTVYCGPAHDAMQATIEVT